MWKCFFVLLALCPSAQADDCGEMEYWDISRQMCLTFPADMSMSMAMLHANLFGAHIWEQGPRGRDAWAGPGMVMTELGTSVGPRNYLNLELMLTADKWTFPDRGYPLLTQIGEQDSNGLPFVDAQHPHSSPIMGLTLSDTVKLNTGGAKDHAKFFFAPRGESTDGPISFMHRPTGEVNPDAPLGHHIGQDVGHISSTVLGTSVRQGAMTYELSTFDGTEPSPEAVDMPIGAPDSVGARIIREFSPSTTAMASFAYVNAPEPGESDHTYVLRYSASVYHSLKFSPDWSFDNSLIMGVLTQADHAGALYSFGEEFLFSKGEPSIWGRIELLQRTAGELAISSDTPGKGKWIGATTLGYTHQVLGSDQAKLGLGGSATRTFLPEEFIGAYGGNPWSGKIFLQLSGMKMWDL